MKCARIFSLLVIGSLLMMGGAACKKTPPKNVTTIEGRKAGAPTEVRNTAPVGPGSGGLTAPPVTTTSPITTASELPPLGAPIGLVGNPDDIDSAFNQDREKFRANIVLFDFDSATVKAKEGRKIEEVAAYLKNNSSSSNKMLVEGHCDERGTEEYNRALGERRALAVREYLVRLGVAPDRVYTRSYGEDRPAMQGQDEAAWSKNRRGEFVVLTPK